MESLELIEKLVSNSEKHHMINLQEENQNKEYEGLTFNIAQHTFRSRLAKKTPKKKGYFVVFWEKDKDNKNQPYAFDEMSEKLIVSIIDGQLIGQFVFPKLLLLQKGILKSENDKGKMAMRVYPSWERELNPSARKTQKWQAAYFIDLSNGIDNQQAAALYFT